MSIAHPGPCSVRNPGGKSKVPTELLEKLRDSTDPQEVHAVIGELLLHALPDPLTQPAPRLLPRFPEDHELAEAAAAAQDRIRTFSTGADRDTDEGKIRPAGALNPAVLRRFCEYMLKHSTRSDGTKRSADNWQRGMPPDEFMESLLRHVFTAWDVQRGGTVVENGETVTLQDALCGVVFNAFGLLHHDLGLCRCQGPKPPS